MHTYGEEYQAWLKTIKVGDRVATSCYGLGTTDWTIWSIVRLTKTQIVCRTFEGRETRFNRERGREVGSGRYTSIEPYTDEIRITKRHNNLARAVSNAADKFVRFSQCDVLSDETLQKMHNILCEAVSEAEAKKIKEV